jgi:hypothetical protein
LHQHRHHLAGFFANRDDARDACSALEQRGLPGAQLQIFSAGSAAPGAAPAANSKAVLHDVLTDGAIGSAVGTGVGALAQLALVSANVSLFVASPLVAPLALLGWGASLGGVIGATRGAMAESLAPALQPDGWFSEMVRDAVASGQVVLLAEAHTAQEMAIAAEVIKASVGDYQDVDSA